MAARHWIGLQALTPVILLVGCGSAPSTAAATPHPSPEPSVSSASLLAYTARGADLGAGWTETPTTDGTSLTITTGEHPCLIAFNSDTERLAKNGVTFHNPNDQSQVFNDVTVYRGTGAQEAIKETRTMLASCTHYTQLNNVGHTVQIDVHASTANVSQVGDDRVVFDLRATVDGRIIYSVVFTVRVGKYLTTIYTISLDGAEAGRLAGLAAAASTLRLKAATGHSG